MAQKIIGLLFFNYDFYNVAKTVLVSNNSDGAGMIVLFL